jgi:hypothetical protein
LYIFDFVQVDRSSPRPACRPATRPNNDADADASQVPVAGKSRNQLPHCNRGEHRAIANPALPEISHFGVKFVECCAACTGALQVFPKFAGIRANVLAMQRGAL